MSKERRYVVAVTETRTLDVIVLAGSRAQAERRAVLRQWQGCTGTGFKLCIRERRARLADDEDDRRRRRVESKP